jgi:hypothetical protein
MSLLFFHIYKPKVLDLLDFVQYSLSQSSNSDMAEPNK